MHYGFSGFSRVGGVTLETSSIFASLGLWVRTGVGWLTLAPLGLLLLVLGRLVGEEPVRPVPERERGGAGVRVAMVRI